MSRKKSVKPGTPMPEVVVEPVIGTTPISPREIADLRKQTAASLCEICDYYQGEEIPQRILDKVDKLKEAKSREQAELWASKATSSMLIHMLALWANGKVFGPATEENIAKKIKRTETLITFLDARGLEKQAEQQRQKLDSLRKMAIDKAKEST